MGAAGGEIAKKANSCVCHRSDLAYRALHSS